VIETLVTVATSLGVDLMAGTPVARVEHAGGRVTGVVLDGGRRLDADVVVVNADASAADALLGLPGAAVLPARERSLSGVVFLLGVKRRLPGVPHHAVYFSGDYAREFADLFDRRVFPDDPTVYVNVPSRSDSTVVPQGQGETLFVMANAPAVGGAWTEQATADAERRVFERLARGGFPRVDDDVVVRDVWTPSRFEACYGAPGGAIYGTHSHGWRRAFLRPANRDSRVSGLYYAGGSTHPGGGTPTVLMSARITAGLIERWA
jgi:phytoene desaturase